jgi:hypothetical protein
MRIGGSLAAAAAAAAASHALTAASMRCVSSARQAASNPRQYGQFIVLLTREHGEKPYPSLSLATRSTLSPTTHLPATSAGGRAEAWLVPP